MSALWENFSTLSNYAFGYVGILVTIGLTRPRVCLRIVEMLDAILLQVLVFVGGAAIALTWARNYVSDPAHHGAFRGPEIGTDEDGSLGDRPIIFAYNAMAGEQTSLILVVSTLALWLVINMGAVKFCHVVMTDKADDAPKGDTRPEHHQPIAKDTET